MIYIYSSQRLRKDTADVSFWRWRGQHLDVTATENSYCRREYNRALNISTNEESTISAGQQGLRLAKNASHEKSRILCALRSVQMRSSTAGGELTQKGVTKPFHELHSKFFFFGGLFEFWPTCFSSTNFSFFTLPSHPIRLFLYLLRLNRSLS